MKVRILSLFFAALMLVTLAACGETPPADGTDSGTESESADTAQTPVADDFDGILHLAQDGASGYVIVRGANALSSEVTAASELQSYLKKITGAELPIVTDEAEKTAREIVVGKTNREAAGDFDRDELGDDGFVIRSTGSTLWLVGGEARGTLYSVFTFLEDYLGCRFYTDTFEKVPEAATVELQPIAEDKQIPVFISRKDWWTVANDPVYSAKRHVNSGAYDSCSFHNLPLLAGTGDSVYGSDPCLTDENVYNLVLEGLRSSLAANPGADLVSVSQGDYGSEKFCRCEKCMAEVEQYGWSGHYLLFVNRVADALREEYPNVMVHTFAYGPTKEPPTGGVRPAENVMVQLCSHENCRFHPFTECTRAFDVTRMALPDSDFAATLRAWSEICPFLSVWDYHANFASYTSTFPNWGALLPNIRLMADNNVKVYWPEGVYSGYGGEFDYLRAYLLSKVMWDPYMTEEEYYALMDEFLEDFYGPGWASIREFIDFSMSVTDHLTSRYVSEMYPSTLYDLDYPTAADLTADQLKEYKNQDWTPYYSAQKVVEPHPLLVKGYELFDAALAAAETDEQRWNIERSRLQLDYMKSYWLYDYVKYAIGSVNTVYAVTVRDKVSRGEIPSSTGNKLIQQFRTYITEKLTQEYYDYNYALAENMIKYNASQYKEGQNLQTRALTEWNFNNRPVELGGDWVS